MAVVLLHDISRIRTHRDAEPLARGGLAEGKWVLARCVSVVLVNLEPELSEWQPLKVWCDLGHRPPELEHLR